MNIPTPVYDPSVSVLMKIGAFGAVACLSLGIAVALGYLAKLLEFLFVKLVLVIERVQK